jgi:hypothetical protein
LFIVVREGVRHGGRPRGDAYLAVTVNVSFPDHLLDLGVGELLA